MPWRDQHYFTLPCVEKTEWKPDGVNWSLWGNRNSTFVLTDTKRSESQSTTPVNGSYVSPTAYAARFFTASGSGGSYEWTWRGRGRKMRTTWSPQPSYAVVAPLHLHGVIPATPWIPAIPGPLVSKAIAEANRKASDQIYDFGQSLGELSTTLPFLLETMLNVGRALRALRTGNVPVLASNIGINRGSASRVVRTAASGYLAWQYGFKPLMADAQAAADLISGKHVPGIRGTVRVNKADSSFGPPGNTPGLVVSYDGKFVRGVEVGYTVSVSNPGLYSLERYGLLDPLALAWELVPMSFVLNWFTGMSDFITALTKPFGLRLEHGYLTRYLDCDYTCSWVGDVHDVTSGTPPKVNVHHVAMNRETFWTFAVPHPYFKLDLGPGFGSKLTALGALTVALGSNPVRL